MWEECRWLNQPAQWSLGPEGLRVTTDRATDFWRETHYGFIRHSGHLFGTLTAGGFTATLRVRARFQELYDQAGLMVRIDERTWVKAGIELSDGEAMLSSVVTVDLSDWATGPFLGNAADFWIRATLKDGVLRLQASADGQRWPLLRLCPFPKSAAYVVGAMCCTPERAGLEVLFPEFSITPPIAKPLHDLS